MARSTSSSARKGERATLQPRADAFARLFEAVHEGVFIGVVPRQDGDRGSTLAANPHLRRMLGIDPSAPDDDVRPFSLSTVLDAESHADFLLCLERDGAVTDYPLRLRRADGTTMWVEVTARAQAAAGALHVEALVRDVSERRRRDDESRALSQHLLQAEKMAALGQTISGVAHELNNPLATILSWAERLAARPLDEVSHRGAQVILNEAERSARIVKNLLTFARKPQSTRSLIDLNHVVRETLARRPRDAEHERIELCCTLADDLPPVLADGHQMQQVLFNLVSNAEHAMIDAHGAGRLTVRTRVYAARRMAVLEISDDGPGIPVEMRGKVFDPFFTTKEVGKGTGLGLTVAYALVEEHGGRIRLESPAEGGARFLVELPLAVGPEAQASVAQPALPVTDLKGTRLLLVEDEVALAGAVAEGLADQGLMVDRAGDGEEALACLRQRSYDAIVCDLKMPRVDGMMLYRAIAATTPALTRRVIFVTGDVAGTDAERFLAETGSRWLAKPFRLADLLRAVRDTVG